MFKKRKAAKWVFVCVLGVTVSLAANCGNKDKSYSVSEMFTDSRDGKTYKTVKIGNQVWMAENLNYVTGNSWCYVDNNSNCAKYGRLYDWNTAMKACPAGWHLPNRVELDSLAQTVGGLREPDDNGNINWSGAGAKLKSQSGWNDNGKGSDDYGFSALPGGGHFSGGDFHYAGYRGFWWSATENDANNARFRVMSYYYNGVSEGWGSKSGGFSVRCLRD